MKANRALKNDKKRSRKRTFYLSSFMTSNEFSVSVLRYLITFTEYIRYVSRQVCTQLVTYPATLSMDLGVSRIS